MPDVTLAAALEPLRVAGRDFSKVDLDATAKGPTDDLGGKMALTARTQGKDVALDAAYGLTPKSLTLSDVDLKAPETDLKGRLVLDRATNLVDGSLKGRAGDLAALEPFIGQRIDGSADLDLAFDATKGRQNVRAKVDAPKVAGAFGMVQGVRLDAAVDDALKAPVVDAALALDRFEQGDLTLSRAGVEAKGKLDGLAVNAGFAGEQGPTPFQLDAEATVDARSRTKSVRLAKLDGRVADEPIRLAAPATFALLPDGYSLDGLDLAYGPARLAGSGRLDGRSLSGDLRPRSLQAFPPLTPTSRSGSRSRARSMQRSGSRAAGRRP